MQVKKIPDCVGNFDIPKTAYCSIKHTGKIKKLYASAVPVPQPGEGCIKRISKDLYMDTRTGEVKEYQHIATNRSQNVESVRRSMVMIRDTINCNILDPSSALWCTLTYAENMTDNVRLREDFKDFNLRFDRYCKKMNYGKPLHIAVPEPQGRGAWHIHVLFFWPGLKAPFLASSEAALSAARGLPPGSRSLQSLWGFGFCSVKKLDCTDNIGAYLSAYLSDLPLDELSEEDLSSVPADCIIEKNVVLASGKTTKKKFVKGERLFRYPNGMKLLWTSKGLKKPVLEKTDFEEGMKKVTSAKVTFSGSYRLLDDSGLVHNSFCIKQYTTDSDGGQ